MALRPLKTIALSNSSFGRCVSSFLGLGPSQIIGSTNRSFESSLFI
jgi:hypothetical protein